MALRRSGQAKNARKSRERRESQMSDKAGGPKHEQEKKQPDVRVNLSDILEGFATSSSGVVKKAASILEEEIAAGIVAAKEVEDKVVNVKKIRMQDKEMLMQRFRRDSHEIVDILLDLMDASVRSAGNVAKRIVSIKPSVNKGESDPTPKGGTPVLEMPVPITPGREGNTSMVFENSLDKETGVLTVTSTDLLSSLGSSITASQVTFSPSSFSIAPHSKREIGITVKVPARKEPGTYSGLVQATGIENLRAVLVVKVE